MPTTPQQPSVISAEALARFASYVNKDGPIQPHVSGIGNCWVWTGSIGTKGYGQFYFNKASEKAHRYSYRANIGDIPPGYDCCHRCDNPACVRPDHLFAGTRSDNMRDAVAKGRKTYPKQKLCKRGHDLSVHSVMKKSGQWMTRCCVLCRRIKQRENRAKLKGLL